MKVLHPHDYRYSIVAVVAGLVVADDTIACASIANLLEEEDLIRRASERSKTRFLFPPGDDGEADEGVRPTFSLYWVLLCSAAQVSNLL